MDRQSQKKMLEDLEAEMEEQLSNKPNTVAEIVDKWWPIILPEDVTDERKQAMIEEIEEWIETDCGPA